MSVSVYVCVEWKWGTGGGREEEDQLNMWESKAEQ